MRAPVSVFCIIVAACASVTHLNERDRVAIAALETITTQLPDSAPLCLQYADSSTGRSAAPRAVLHAVSRFRMITTPRKCPPTYESMILVVDSAGRPLERPRPPGYVDPHWTVVRPIRFHSADRATLRVDMDQGTEGFGYGCAARRVESRWQALCQIVDRWVH
jgi:hypothetical protein